MKILYLVTDDSFFWSHRRSLAAAARDAGSEVVVATQPGPLRERIEAEGFRFVPVRMGRSLRPDAVARGVADVTRLYREQRPDLVHHVAMRPVFTGTLAAWRSGVPSVVNHVTGLGWVFTAGPAPLRWTVERLYRASFAHPGSRAIFQNSDDRDHFVERRLVDPGRCQVILGSGVDTERYRPVPEPAGTPRVLLASRMLRAKGIADLVEAGRILRDRGVDHGIVLAGRPDEKNPSSIPAAELDAWHDAGLVDWKGQHDDVAALLAEAHVACLPTYYREGVPKFLLEAMSCGRPVVTTRTPGCREVVEPGTNGLLVDPRRPDELADALQELLLDPDLRRSMGEASRHMVGSRFSDPVVIDRTFDVYRELTGGAWSTPGPDPVLSWTS